MGCTPSILSNDSNNQQQHRQHQLRKDSGLYLRNVATTSSNGSSSNRNECAIAAKNKLSDNIPVNQSIVNASYTIPKNGMEKESAKKDSIVSITASGHIASFPIVSATVRRPTAGSGTASNSGRYGHRKSSLALTPEEEPLDQCPHYYVCEKENTAEELCGNFYVKFHHEIGLISSLRIAYDVQDQASEQMLSKTHFFWPRTFGRRSQNSWKPTLFAGILEEQAFESETRLVSDVKFPNLLPPNPLIKILIAFCKNDPVFDALVNASHRLSFEPTFVKSAEAAIDAFHNPVAGDHHIIIVDARYPRMIEAEALGRSIRNSKGCQHTTMVAVVKKSVFEKDDTAVISLLDAGYNRCIIESPHVSICSSELRQIQHSLVRPQNVISTQQALYAALHRSREAIIITDDTLRTQYANRASERVLNMKLDEIVGRSLSDLVTADISNILSHTSRYKDYDGYLTTRRKSQESTQIHVRAVPVSCIGRNPTHLVLILESASNALAPLSTTSEPLHTLPQGKEVARGSLHSIRRPSFDVRSIASDGLRRTSLVKLSSLPLEAPITKVLSLLAQVQENCSLDEAKLLDRVMEFLKREGLYSPQMKEIRPEDPVATDLIGALLTHGPTNILSSRRSSNDSIIRGGGRPSTGSIVFHKTKESSLLSDLLHTALDWDFEIFKLEEFTDKRPLVCLGLELLRRFDVYNTFNCDEMTFKLWLIEMEKSYHSENTYHNSTHAADVMQATAVYLQQLSNRELKIMDRMDEATALIAAATHDIDHPGRSSAFLCNSDSMLALLYNDICVLESHHAATTFRLTLADDKINIFKNLDRDMYKLARSIIVDMILATEMTRHFEHLAKFVNVFGSDVESKDPLPPDNDDNQILVRRMLIKCADVSNPTRPLKFCVEWARRIAEEYFMQTDEEKHKNLPIVMPMFDRTTCSISKSQIGFIEYIIHDMMDAWNSFIEMPEIVRYMEFNYSQWKLFEEQGINTLSDIKRKQLSLVEEPSSTISLEEKF